MVLPGHFISIATQHKFTTMHLFEWVFDVYLTITFIAEKVKFKLIRHIQNDVLCCDEMKASGKMDSSEV